MPVFRDPVGLTISRKEAAQVSGFTVHIIDRLRDAGEIETVEIAGREFISRRSFNGWLARVREQAAGFDTPAENAA